jgi:dehydrodolichyl diphosphate syntase complex subunit NUS1
MASTGVGPRESYAFRRNQLDGKALTAKEREQLLKPWLPDEPLTSPSAPKAPSPVANGNSIRSSQRQLQKKRKTGFFRHSLHVLIFAAISFLFSIFLRFRRAWHLVKSKVVSLLKYHHRTPEFIQRDTKHLGKLPTHVSVILEFHEDDEEQGTAGLEGLVNDVCEIAAWTASAGIPFLSVYERTGAHSLQLKVYVS